MAAGRTNATEIGGRRHGRLGVTPLAPPRSHATVVNGTRVAWAEQGSGEALVLLHGIGDSRRTWRCVGPVLARRYRVLVPDLPGHGQSGRPDAPYTLTWFARMVSDWMAVVDVPHAHVVGHSFGGGVAQWMLLEHRAKVDRVALVAAGGLGTDVGWTLRLAAVPFPEGFCTPSAMRLGTMLSVLMSRRTFGYPTLAEIVEAARLNGLPDTGRSFCRTLRGVIDVSGQSVQTYSRVADVETLPPVALFWGAKDRVIPVEHGRRALALFPGASLTVFPGCGHYPHLEEPGKFASKLMAFLGRPPALPPEEKGA